MDEELESEDPAFEQLIKHIDSLPPDVYEIHVSPDGNLISTSADPKDDETRCAYYPPLDSVQRPEGVQVISRSHLQEIDRLGPNVDLVTCPQSSEPTQKVSSSKPHFSPPSNSNLVRLQILLPPSTPVI